MSVSVHRKDLTNEQASFIASVLTLQPKPINKFERRSPPPAIKFFSLIPTKSESKDAGENYDIRLPYAFGVTLLQKYVNNDRDYIKIDIRFTGKLFDKQVPIAEEIRTQLKNYNTTILRLPPGWGKTVLGALMACENKILTCVLFHRTIIGEAWKNTFTLFTTAKVWTVGTPYPNDHIPDVILCLDQRVPTLPTELLDKVGCLIIDEAHCFCTPSHVDILLAFQPKIVIAETATLERDDSMHSMIQSICGSHFVYRGNDKPFTVYKVETGIEPEYKLNVNGETDWASLSRSLSRDSLRNSLIIQLIILLQQQKVLILTNTKIHCTILYDALKSIGCSVDYMMGTKNSYVDSQVLIGTFSKIGTGFDEKAFCPTFNGVRISAVILASSIKKESLLEQNVGRAFRAEFPTVYHLVDNNKTIRNHWSIAKRWYERNMGTVSEIMIPNVVNIFETKAAKPKLVVAEGK